MRIAITTVQVPFIHGGAELMTNKLSEALKERGHQIEVISAPFVFNCKNSIRDNMDYWQGLDFNRLDVGKVDGVICLKFPTYYLQHPNKIVWLMHQHRSVYDLWGTAYGDASTDENALNLREDIIKRDKKHLRKSVKNYTISKTVSKRLKKFNDIDSEYLYQPSPLSNYLSPGAQNPYIFCPGRLEGLKRQELLIRSVLHCKTDCNILIAGTGSLGRMLQELITELELQHKVRLLGYVTEAELINLYRNALGVYFAPVEEDYGFVTLEAMQAAKPVITCNDSGGSLEFIKDEETGFIVDPKPELIAEKIDDLYSDRERAKAIGMNGLEAYNALNLSWDNIIDELLNNFEERK